MNAIPPALMPSTTPNIETVIRRKEMEIADLEQTISNPRSIDRSVERQLLITTTNTLRILMRHKAASDLGTQKQGHAAERYDERLLPTPCGGGLLAPSPGSGSVFSSLSSHS